MSLRHALLGLLAEHPASGYDLIKQFETSLAMVWPAQQSQVYDGNGLIEVTGTGARNRREYGITDAGREELRRWLTQPDVDIAYRSAALLRVFFLWTLNREEATKYLDDFAEHNRERLAALESVRDNTAWVGDPVQWATERLTEHL